MKKIIIALIVMNVLTLSGCNTQISVRGGNSVEPIADVDAYCAPENDRYCYAEIAFFNNDISLCSKGTINETDASYSFDRSIYCKNSLSQGTFMFREISNSTGCKYSGTESFEKCKKACEDNGLEYKTPTEFDDVRSEGGFSRGCGKSTNYTLTMYSGCYCY